MATPVNLLTLKISDVRKWAPSKGALRLVDKRRNFYEGEHYKGGKYWAGPVPEDQQTRNDFFKRLDRHIVTENMCAQVVERRSDAVTGRDPVWTPYPLPEAGSADEEGVEEDTDDLRDWWTERRVHQAWQEAISKALAFGGSGIRMMIPPAYIAAVEPDGAADDTEEEGETLEPPDDFAGWLRVLKFEVHAPGDCGVYTDPETGLEYGWYAGKNYAEVSFVRPSDGVTELWVYDSGRDPIKAEIDIGGLLTHHGVDLQTMITEQVMQQNATLNKALTMSSANLDWSAFIERIFLNARKPGKWVTKDGGKVWEETPYRPGPATTTFAEGLRTTDAAGKESITTPSVVFRTPEKTEIFTSEADLMRFCILNESDQLHVLISADANASGDARIQALSEFRRSLRKTVREATYAGRWMLEGGARMASVMSGTTLEFERLQFQPVIDVGPVSSDFARILFDAVEKGKMTLETALSMLGVENVTEEVKRLETGSFNRLQLLKKQVEVMGELEALGLPLETIAKLVGLEPKVVQVISAARGQGTPDL